MLRVLRTSFAAQLAVGLVLAAALGVGVGLGGGGDAPPTPAPSPAETSPGPAEAAPAPEEPAAAAPASARQTFAHTCGMCHALRAAGTTGGFGPDLDGVRPSAAWVRRMIRTGTLDGVMQPGLLQGDDARRVAAYVARVAGKR